MLEHRKFDREKIGGLFSDFIKILALGEEEKKQMRCKQKIELTCQTM